MSRFLILLIINIFFLCGQACAARAVIIDTDAAFDDMLAITYLLQRPDIDVKAITIAAAGESHCQPAKANLNSLTTLLKHPHIPISCGREKPLLGEHRFPASWSQFTDQLGNIRIKKEKLKEYSDDATTLIKRLLANSKESYDIIAIGPLTNLAEVFQQAPALRKKIHMLYIMGGAVHVPGNLQIGDPTLNATAEWNFYIDPTAADIVFRSGAPITLIPLDATQSTKLDRDFFSTLAKATANPAAAFISQLHQASLKYQQSDMDWFIWDTVTAAIASNERIATSKIEKLKIILTPESQVGSVVIDNQHGSPIRVCHDVNQKQMMHDLIYFLTHT